MLPVNQTPPTRILLVEDEAIIALDLKHRLEGLGYEVTGTAANGADALALADATTPNLVFMDITIQGPIDGVETAERLLSRMDVPIVFLTAHTDARTIRRAKEVRPYGYLVKPFEERELSTTVEMAVYRHRTEAQGRLLQHAMTSANTGIVVANAKDPELAITLCNPAFERITGYTTPEIVGQSPWFLEGTDVDRTASGEIRRALEEKREAQVTLLVHRKDGTTFWEDLAVSPVRNASGEVTHFLFFHTDASARKDAEGALVQSQKVEAIGQLAGGVAHDFNNILAVITGYCEMAQGQVGDDHAARPRLDQILKAVKRGADLTRQLLAFSRKQILLPRPIDLNVIVAETDRMLGRLISADITLVVRQNGALGTVFADPGQMEQIIINLAVNARDAMPHGGTLTLGTENVELDAHYAAAHPSVQPGSYVLLTVSDTGAGMTPDVQARIFEPFFTTKAEGHGTGLGLATVYGIVKQSGGNIWVYSEPGFGTTFRIYFPRVDRASVTSPRAAALAPPRGTETILLAEDTDALRAVIEESLRSLGYRVLAAKDGIEAVALGKAFASSIDLLLTDVVMPRMSGADLAKAVQEFRPDIRVLFMSGYTDGALAHHELLMPGASLVEKPFSRDKLARTVRDSLDRKLRVVAEAQTV